MRPTRFLGGLPVLAIVLPFAIGLAGCSFGVQDILPDQTLAYKKSRQAEENLELPPDLKGGSFDDAMDVPPIAGGATYSDYAGGRAERRQTAGAQGDVLPTVANVDLRREGNNRWLDVQASPQQVWPRVISFWREQGILLAEQNPTVGVMKTDWIENRAEIRKDFVTRMLSKVAGGLYSASTRDQFTVRIDQGAKPGITEVHLTHRGMEEKLVSNSVGENANAMWEASGNNSDKEAEMLRRLMLYLGASQQKAATLAQGGGGSAAAAPSARPSSARLANEGGAQVLIIPDEMRRGWRMTGSALDRAGFAVEDRDMSRGVFFVRYQDADAGARGREKPSWASRLAFWRKDDIDRVKQYQIRVQGNDTETRVSVLDAKGQPDTSPAAGQILALLQAQMN